MQSLGNTTALTPPVPIFNENSGGDSNWPLHNIISSEFELLKNKPDPVNVFAMTSEAKIEETNIGFDEVDPVFSSEKGGWGDDIDMDFEIE